MTIFAEAVAPRTLTRAVSLSSESVGRWDRARLRWSRRCAEGRDQLNLAVVTNDIFTKEDAELLTRRGALPQDRILVVNIQAARI
jgi:hypothetical protein